MRLTDIAKRGKVSPAAVAQWKSGKCSPTNTNLQRIVESDDSNLGEFYATAPKRKRKAA